MEQIEEGQEAVKVIKLMQKNKQYKLGILKEHSWGCTVSCVVNDYKTEQSTENYEVKY